MAKKTEDASDNPKRSFWQRFIDLVKRAWSEPPLTKGDPPSTFQVPYLDSSTTSLLIDATSTKERAALAKSIREEGRKDEALKLARADLEVTKEALHRTLTLSRHSVFLAGVTTVIALAAFIVALFHPSGTTVVLQQEPHATQVENHLPPRLH